MQLNYRITYKIVILLAGLFLTVSLFLALNEGNQASAVVSCGYYTSNGPGPRIDGFTPCGTINTTSTNIGANITDTATFWPSGYGGFDPATVSVTLDGTPVSGCTISGSDLWTPGYGPAVYRTGSVSCPASGLTEGIHNFVVTATSAYRVTSTGYGSFTVSTCTPAKPNLAPSVHYAFWGSYADYTARELTVQTVFSNNGSENAYGVTMTGATCTNGVTLSSSVPFIMGDVMTSSSVEFGIKYHIPVGVTGFSATIGGSASDTCGTGYTYP